MRTESNAEDHLTSDLEPPITSGMPWRVTHVEASPTIVSA
jgi:hypothetical protein